jgi:hypothetical protein
MEGGEIIVVSDACGFVGAFRDIMDAKLKVLDRFKLVPFLVQRFPFVSTETILTPPDNTVAAARQSSAASGLSSAVASECSSNPPTVWVVPYRDTNAVAYVSNSRSRAVRVQKSLENVGLTYPDSIDYWQQPLGMVVLAAGERLASITRAHQIYANESIREEEKRKDEAAEELIKRVVDGADESPLDRLIRENERITIFDCVVDIIDDTELHSDDTELHSDDTELHSDDAEPHSDDAEPHSDDADVKSPVDINESKD